MDRAGQRVKFSSYESPNSRELEGSVIKSVFDDTENGFGWYHVIDSDVEFVDRRPPLNEKVNIIRVESELIK